MNKKKPIFGETTIGAVSFVVIVLPALLMFSGCASLSKAQCLNGDWYEIGLNDGKSGVESEQFNVYVDTCAKYDIVPDFAKYSEGRTKGLEFFCTRSNGYAEGREGRAYQNVCSGTSEELFLEGYSFGYNIHSKEEIVEDLDSKIQEKIKQIENLETELEKIRGDQGRSGGGVDRLISQSVEHESDITEAKTRVKALQASKAEAMKEYRKAIDEANENGFREEATIEYLEIDDEGDVIGTQP